MRRNLILLLGAGIIFAIGFGAGFLTLLYSTGGLTDESSNIADVAPTLSLVETEASIELEMIATEIALINQRLDNLTVDSITDPESEGTENAVELPSETRALYRIIQDDSSVIFRISETVLGNPNLVEATTSRVAGDVIVNFTNPITSQVGQLAINARTFRTDDEYRDQSIRGHILESDTYEFITFTPTELLELPDTPVGVGQTVAFQIMGDLTVRDVTQSVTFDVSVTIDSDEQISGMATAMINYTDFNLTINPPPGISDITEELEIELQFVAEFIEASE